MWPWQEPAAPGTITGAHATRCAVAWWWLSAVPNGGEPVAYSARYTSVRGCSSAFACPWWTWPPLVYCGTLGARESCPRRHSMLPTAWNSALLDPWCRSGTALLGAPLLTSWKQALVMVTTGRVVSRRARSVAGPWRRTSLRILSVDESSSAARDQAASASTAVVLMSPLWRPA